MSSEQQEIDRCRTCKIAQLLLGEKTKSWKSYALREIYLSSKNDVCPSVQRGLHWMKGKLSQSAEQRFPFQLAPVADALHLEQLVAVLHRDRIPIVVLAGSLTAVKQKTQLIRILQDGASQSINEGSAKHNLSWLPNSNR